MLESLGSVLNKVFRNPANNRIKGELRFDNLCSSNKCTQHTDVKHKRFSYFLHHRVIHLQLDLLGINLRSSLYIVTIEKKNTTRTNDMSIGVIGILGKRYWHIGQIHLRKKDLFIGDKEITAGGRSKQLLYSTGNFYPYTAVLLR